MIAIFLNWGLAAYTLKIYLHQSISNWSKHLRSVVSSIIYNFFENYILKCEKGKVISFVSLVQVTRDYDENLNISLKGIIVIQYYKSYLPFPSNFQNYQQLKEQNKLLFF